MSGLRSGSADATPAPVVHDNARAPTATTSLDVSLTIFVYLPTNTPSTAAATSPSRRRLWSTLAAWWVLSEAPEQLTHSSWAPPIGDESGTAINRACNAPRNAAM